MEASRRREGYKFIKMTSGEAIRKGSKKFASEIANLTGGRKEVGPPPSNILIKGMLQLKLNIQKESFIQERL